ncbi:hypothetical protein MA16_Dca009301 [Dendrobium catenatum]|uniref:Uncharacterized protein n=1 Tax=Dendrobium catenatum TaxID=906689 RepID=A0A2I0WZ00_9ASPA|nr:hypothetical protein MA16_Dca009301 [Dendrobium catenatum]
MGEGEKRRRLGLSGEFPASAFRKKIEEDLEKLEGKYPPRSTRSPWTKQPMVADKAKERNQIAITPPTKPIRFREMKGQQSQHSSPHSVQETERRRPRETNQAATGNPAIKGTEEPAQRTEHQHGKIARGHGNSKGQEEIKETKGEGEKSIPK